MASHTNRSAIAGRFVAVRTTFCIDRHVWHQGAHRSTTTRLPLARAAAKAASGASSYQAMPLRICGDASCTGLMPDGSVFSAARGVALAALDATGAPLAAAPTLPV